MRELQAARDMLKRASTLSSERTAPQEMREARAEVLGERDDDAIERHERVTSDTLMSAYRDIRTGVTYENI